MPRRPALLLVDDDEAIRELTRCLVQGMGWDVVATETGEEAVARFRAEPSRFTLVLLDLSLPRMQGTEVLAELRATSPDVVVVMATGHGEDILAAVPELRLFGIMRKPYRFSELEETINRAARLVRAA